MSYIGSTAVFAVKFTNADGDDADPTNVRLILKEAIDGTELEWIYSSSPTEGTHYPVGTNPIVKDSPGDYSLEFTYRKPERHVGFWIGDGNDVDQTVPFTTFVRHSLIEAVDF
jgi:hypothetical protein